MRAIKAREASNSTSAGMACFRSGTGEPANHSTGCLQAGHFESPVENHLSPLAMWMWWRHGIVAVETASTPSRIVSRQTALGIGAGLCHQAGWLVRDGWMDGWKFI